MQKDTFVSYEYEAWWLLESYLLPPLAKRRDVLGECFDGGAPKTWFKDRYRLEELWDFLEGQQPSLLAELDQVNTPREREEWLEKVIHAKGFPRQRDPVTKAWVTAKSMDEFFTLAEAVVEKPSASGDEVTSEKPSALGIQSTAPKPSAFGAQSTALKPPSGSKPSPFKKKAGAADGTVPMQKDTFVSYEYEAWWLLESDLLPPLAKRRDVLGECFDGGAPKTWFKDRYRLEELWDFLEGQQPSLLAELDQVNTPREREEWLEKVIHAKGFPRQRDPVTKAWVTAKSMDEFFTLAEAVVEKPSASGDEVTSEKPSALGIQSTAPKPPTGSKPSPFGSAKKRIIAGREIRLALDDLDAVLDAADESDEDAAEDTLRRLSKAISDHKSAADVGAGLRLTTILGLCDVYLDSHPHPSGRWAGKRVAVVEDLKAEAMLEWGRRRAEEQYLKDAYAKPGQSLTAMSAQSEKTRKLVHSEAQEIGTRVGLSDPLINLGPDSPVYWSTIAAQQYGLTEAEVLAVRVYTSDDYKYINAATANAKDLMEQRQFKGKPEDYLTSEQGRAEMKRFFEEGSLHGAMAIAALEKLPVESGTCYRGSRMTPERFKQRYGDAVNKKLPSRTLTELTSLSTLREAAAKFANESDDRTATVSVMTEIEVIRGRNISDLSLYMKEKELLLLPGTVLETISWVEEDNGEVGDPKAEMWVYVKTREK